MRIPRSGRNWATATGLFRPVLRPTGRPARGPLGADDRAGRGPALSRATGPELALRRRTAAAPPPPPPPRRPRRAAEPARVDAASSIADAVTGSLAETVAGSVAISPPPSDSGSGDTAQEGTDD